MMNALKLHRALFLATLLAILPMTLVTPALAHAELTLAAPAVDSIGPAPAPPELRLSFSEPLELAFTRVVISGVDGLPLELGPLVLDPADSKLLLVPLKASLAAGIYTVDWTAVAADGHKSENSYSFTITP